jgi:hypothetical protein
MEMKHCIAFLLALSLAVSAGRFNWTVTNDAQVTNFVIDCTKGTGHYGWDLTKAAQFTAPLYNGDMRSLPTSHVTMQQPGSYSCVIRTYAGPPLVGGMLLETSNTVSLNQ